MKILIVDDEKLLVKGMRFNLENEGYDVDTVYNGEDALELATKNNMTSSFWILCSLRSAVLRSASA